MGFSYDTIDLGIDYFILNLGFRILCFYSDGLMVV